MTDIVLAVPAEGAASFQRALETMSPEIAARVREWPGKAVIPITILTDGIEAPREFRSWCLLDEIARLDGIEPPTGEALREVLTGMYTIPDEGIEAQILRW